MNRVQRTIVCLIPGGTLIVQIPGLAVARFPLADLYMAIASAPLFISTALAISVLALRRGEIVRQLLVGAAFSTVLMVLLLAWGNGHSAVWAPATLGFWCGAILVSTYRVVKTSGPERLREFDRALVVAALPLIVPVAFAGLEFTAQFVERTYDNFFYAFDGLLPIPMARIIAQFCANHPWAWSAAGIVYYDYLLVLCAFVVLQWRHNNGEVSAQVLSRWVIATLLGYGLYYCLPGVGPGVAFYGVAEPRFDSLPSPFQVELTILDGFEGQPRNAMPSLHATWALLIALMSLRMAFWFRVFGAFYALGTAIVTLGLREHYFIDLVVAVPFAVAVHAGTGLLEQGREFKAQLLAALGGAAMTVIWLFIIRYGTAPLRSVPEIASALVIVTLAGSAWLVFRSEAECRKVFMRYHNRERPGGEPALAA